MKKRIKGIFQHYLNEYHIYCRLIDAGFSKKRSRLFAKGFGRLTRCCLYRE